MSDFECSASHAKKSSNVTAVSMFLLSFIVPLLPDVDNNVSLKS